MDAPSSLAAFFSPRTVAVLGATEAAGSVGRALMENLREFAGPVFPINPRRDSVLGRKAFSSIAGAPAPVDLAIIATPAPTVPQVVGECAAAGVRAAVIISAGFKECGAEGAAREREILANQGGMRIFGPNCLGLLIPSVGLNASFAATNARAGRVAFLSQSGALCTAILDWSRREEVGFSAFISLGSMLDVGWGDLIEYLGRDPRTESIVCYMESIGNARAFLSAARAVACRKPILVLKVGRTEAAAHAAASHTGALTGRDAVFDAAFHRAGVLRVDTIEELFDMASVLAKQPRPSGPRLAIVTNAGGPAALATDMLVTAGAQLAPLSNSTKAALDAFLPAEWSHGNPIDLLGAANATDFGKATALAVRDETTDGALVVLTPQAMTDPGATAAAIAAVAVSSEKPVLASFMGGASVEAAHATLTRAGIPTYAYPDEAARAFALMWKHSDRLRLLAEQPAALFPDRIEDAAGPIIDAVSRAGRVLLTELESKRVLAAAGLPIVETHVAMSSEEAVAIASQIGWPVVVKLHSETITHKSDVGGVRLDLDDADAVRAAWREIAESAGARNFHGVTVQRMIARGGVELILGSSVDSQFGPVLLFGAGGELVEILPDHALGFPPLTPTLAARLIENTRIARVLRGVRGRAPVDLAALGKILVAFSHLVAAQPRIAEIEINPLVAAPDRIVALDARVVLHPSALPDDALPRPAFGETA